MNIPHGKVISGAQTTDMPESSAKAFLKFLANPEACDEGDLIGTINALVHLTVDVDNHEADTFLPILLPALQFALNRLEGIAQGEIYDPKWRENLRGFIQPEEKH